MSQSGDAATESPRSRFKAAIFDLDGVLTRTAAVHAAAWKSTFDDVLNRRGEDQAPFDVESDYRRYVDGMPRFDGVRSFLASRGIEVPEGDPDDRPEEETIYGIGNRKNEHFQHLLKEKGVDTFDDAVEQLRRWRAAGLKTAVVSSSRNCVPVLEAAGLSELFDAKVDGVDAAEIGLQGKPDADIFLEAARRLEVRPRDAIVLEDAVSGVKAGRAGGFGLVVGVARDRQQDLAEHGADVVVYDVRELEGR
ncbi:MAG: beta-phosphoglucomutase family hydrolase [Rhodothermales bacterium]